MLKRILLLMLLLGVLAAAGCGYGDVSPMAYQYAKAIYSIANRQASDRLVAVSKQIDSSLSTGELSAREAGWLRDIVSDASKGKWQVASESCRRMMEDQIDW